MKFQVKVGNMRQAVTIIGDTRVILISHTESPHGSRQNCQYITSGKRRKVWRALGMSDSTSSRPQQKVPTSLAADTLRAHTTVFLHSHAGKVVEGTYRRGLREHGRTVRRNVCWCYWQQFCSSLPWQSWPRKDGKEECGKNQGPRSTNGCKWLQLQLAM